MVQKYRLVQFIPDLHRALAGADWKVRLLGIEGLIQLRSQVLPDELRGIATNFRESALVLAARHPAQFQDSLVTLLRGQLGSEEWLAVNNLLVKLKSPNVAGPLMQGLCLKIQVVLRDAGSNNIGFVLDGLACASAGGELRPDDYPPRYGYRLKSYGDQGDSLLAPGRRPVFVRRTLDWRFASVSIDRTAAGFEYLEDLLGPENLLDLRSGGLEIMESPTVTTYMTGLGRLRAKTIASYRRVEQTLLNLKLLTAKEAAGLHFEIAWNIEDRRDTSKNVKLPQWPATETISH